MNAEKLGFRNPAAMSIQCSPMFRKERKNLQMLVTTSNGRKAGGMVELPAEVSCSHNKFQVSTLDTGSLCSHLDDGLSLKDKSQEVVSFLDGRCIYLVGMMGSGKTTVGRILSDVLDYCFQDSDKLVEHACGKSGAELFQLYGEGNIREKETEALRTLSLMHRLVVYTGGGADVRPINWKYMQKGITVYIDVTLEALAKEFRLLELPPAPSCIMNLVMHTQRLALTHLSTLLEERADDYANADAKVSLENTAAKMGQKDISNLTPTMIAVEIISREEKAWLHDHQHLQFPGILPFSQTR